MLKSSYLRCKNLPIYNNDLSDISSGLDIFTERISIMSVNTTGYYDIPDISSYKKIIVYLAATNIYGSSRIYDVSLIKDTLIDGVYDTLNAGVQGTDYYAYSSYCFMNNRVYIATLYSPQENYSFNVYGIR